MSNATDLLRKGVSAAGGFLDGWFGGTDGGSFSAPSTQRTETAPLDQSPDPSANIKSGMDSKTMLMIGGGLIVVVALILTVKK